MSRGEDYYKYLLALNYFLSWGPLTLKNLLDNFPSPRKIWEAKISDLEQFGINKKSASAFAEARSKINPERAWEKLKKEKIKMLSLEDSEYPELLKEIYAAPLCLYYRGNINLLQDPLLAIVGSRKCSSYGLQAIQRILTNLLNNYEINTVSGLALGIDTQVHKSTLEENQATVAVLGSGIDRTSLYPGQNRALAEKIINQNGLVISEFPPGIPALKQNFPQRNRIVSGISLGTWVVEAASRSGALITANYALEQNREVMALPGNIFSPTSAGTNQLIKKGAKLIENADEIAETLNLTKTEKSANNNKQIEFDLSETEKTVLSSLTYEPRDINRVIKETNLTTSEVSSNLSLLELKGIIQKTGDSKYFKLYN